MAACILHHYASELTSVQCTLPVLDGLLPAPHNDTILDLVFVMGCWHTYAKLQLHTEETLASFEHLTTDLGILLRHFSSVTCSAFKTTELPRERAARIRRTTNTPGSGGSGGGPKNVGFNLHTYKLHALGDYPRTICEFGTTDNYTTQRVSLNSAPTFKRPSLTSGDAYLQVELEHRTSKVIYPHINKHDPERDIGRLHRRQEVLQYLDKNHSDGPAPKRRQLDSGERFKMSEDSTDCINLMTFTTAFRDTTPYPAKKVGNGNITLQAEAETIVKDFVKKLKNYILRWTSKLHESITSYDHFTNEDQCHVKILSNALYRHKTLQLTYTTYDMREDQDKLNQRRYQDIMVLSDSEDHPYLYGQVLDIFHTKVTNDAPNTILDEGLVGSLLVVWIQWFKLNGPQGSPGFGSLRYPSVSFYNGDDEDAFGFIHPDEIVRSAHLIPSFKSGHTEQHLEGPSKGQPETGDKNWKHFNVNM